MKVLLLAPVPPPDHGGIINWSRLVKTECAKQPDIQLSFVDSALRYRDVTNMSILLRLTFGSAQAIRDVFRVAKQFYQWRPHLFHLCTSAGPASLKDAILIAVAKLFNIPVAVHYRMGRLPQILSEATIENIITCFVLRNASVVLVLGSSSESAVRNICPRQHVMNLPNMVDLLEVDAVRYAALKHKEQESVINLTFVGHVIPTKGICELVDACKELKNRCINLHLVGPCSDNFRELLINKACGGRAESEWLHFHGAVDHNEALHHISVTDLFILPSYTEGAPNVILEAMGLEKPILSTDVGSVPEMLNIYSSDPCGVCVKPKDYKAIRAAVEDFLEFPKKWHKMAYNARRRAELVYATPVVCKSLIDIWMNISNN